MFKTKNIYCCESFWRIVKCSYAHKNHLLWSYKNMVRSSFFSFIQKLKRGVGLYGLYGVGSGLRIAPGIYVSYELFY